MGDRARARAKKEREKTYIRTAKTGEGGDERMREEMRNVERQIRQTLHFARARARESRGTS